MNRHRCGQNQLPELARFNNQIRPDSNPREDTACGAPRVLSDPRQLKRPEISHRANCNVRGGNSTCNPVRATAVLMASGSPLEVVTGTRLVLLLGHAHGQRQAAAACVTARGCAN